MPVGFPVLGSTGMYVRSSLSRDISPSNTFTSSWRLRSALMTACTDWVRLFDDAATPIRPMTLGLQRLRTTATRKRPGCGDFLLDAKRFCSNRKSRNSDMNTIATSCVRISSGKRRANVLTSGIWLMKAINRATTMVQPVRHAAACALSRESVSAMLSASMARMITGKKAKLQSSCDPRRGPSSRPPTMMIDATQRMTATRANSGRRMRRMLGRMTMMVPTMRPISRKLGRIPIS